MKHYYEIYPVGIGWFITATTKDRAKIERELLQGEGYTRVCIRKKHSTSRISDFHSSH